jgi:hypothetical protein
MKDLFSTRLGGVEEYTIPGKKFPFLYPYRSLILHKRLNESVRPSIAVIRKSVRQEKMR